MLCAKRDFSRQRFLAYHYPSGSKPVQLVPDEHRPATIIKRLQIALHRGTIQFSRLADRRLGMYLPSPEHTIMLE
jgi:hypothetical protein